MRKGTSKYPLEAPCGGCGVSIPRDLDQSWQRKYCNQECKNLAHRNSKPVVICKREGCNRVVPYNFEHGYQSSTCSSECRYSCLENCKCYKHSGHVFTEEERQRMSDSAILRWSREEERLAQSERAKNWPEEVKLFHRERISHWWEIEEIRESTLRGQREHCEWMKSRPSEVREVSGYLLKNRVFDHPLSDRTTLFEHRRVLYDKIGSGLHYCYWSCGKLLNWWGLSREEWLCTDHLDGDKLNNDPENLVPSCSTCNLRRGLSGNPIDWIVDYVC